MHLPMPEPAPVHKGDLAIETHELLLFGLETGLISAPSYLGPQLVIRNRQTEIFLADPAEAEVPQPA